VQAGDADVGEPDGGVAVGGEDGGALVGHAEVRRAGGGHDDRLGAVGFPGRHTSVVPYSCPDPSTARQASTCSLVVRVTMTGPSPLLSSSATMPAQCSGALPGPYTASGRRWRRWR
jgi:hypothetical protein